MKEISILVKDRFLRVGLDVDVIAQVDVAIAEHRLHDGEMERLVAVECGGQVGSGRGQRQQQGGHRKSNPAVSQPDHRGRHPRGKQRGKGKIRPEALAQQTEGFNRGTGDERAADENRPRQNRDCQPPGPRSELDRRHRHGRCNHPPTHGAVARRGRQRRPLCLEHDGELLGEIRMPGQVRHDADGNHVDRPDRGSPVAVGPNRLGPPHGP